MEYFRGVSYVTAAEMAEIDALATDEFDVDMLSLMENAGAATARLAKTMLGAAVGAHIACLVGKGNNGGDGLVAARHLKSWGAEVTVFLSGKREGLREAALEQLRRLQKSVRVEEEVRDLSGYSLIVDALLGYNSKGDPREPIASMIMRTNESSSQVLAVDIPSGFDPDTGEIRVPCVEAEATVALGLPKVGFLNPAAGRYLGALYVADISIPLAAYQRMGFKPPDFGGLEVVRLR